MDINITGHHLEVTPALRDLTENKFERLERHFDRITSINVTFHVENLMQIAEATIHVPKAEIHARSENEDLYAAVDHLVDKLHTQLMKHKEKMQHHRE